MNESPETAHAMHREEQATSLPGNILRAEREARDLTVHQVASELHVADRMLLALEKDDFDAIGAAIFVKGHLRNYARLLGLDPEPLLEAYDQYAHPTPPELVGRRPQGIPVESDSGGPLLKIAGWVFVLILLFAAAGWWYYQQESVQGVADRIDILMSTDADGTVQDDPAGTGESDIAEPSFADRLAVAEKAAGNAADEADPRATIASPEDDQPDLAETGERSIQEQQTTAEDAAATESNDTPRESDPVATESTQSQPQSRSTDSATGMAPADDAAVAPGYMQLEFSEASWAEAYDAEGDVLLYDLVPGNTIRRIEAAGEVRVFLGNAPAVDIILNGEAFDTARYIRRDNTARFSIDLTPTE